MPRVTLKTIARECGVSVSTVSLALSGKGKISSRRVDRIRKKAEELGYKPNPLLASLASKRFRSGEASLGNLIALLNFPLNPEGSRPGRSVYGNDLLRWSRELGYHPELFDYKRMRSYADLANTLYRRGTQGIIVFGQPDLEMFTNKEKWSGFSIVQCARFRIGLPIHTVRPDIFRSTKKLFTRLTQLGYRRIGFGFGRHFPMMEDDESRFAAVMALQTFYLEEEERIPPYTGDLSDRESFLAWVESHQPDVVVGFSEAQWYSLKDAGYTIPGDLGFASLHLHLPRRAGAPVLAGLEQRQSQIARQSVILLDQLIRHNSRGFPENPHNVLLESVWHDGDTLPPK
ncbi:MAG: LacI family DNA-binding transcriptional regulator [Verrucomicrobia bacterium]|jgi:LacI family transcriptional regulator|nr:LacI family DNA-binding transcriptional regulator [Verrucomicrobiota bacterium]